MKALLACTFVTFCLVIRPVCNAARGHSGTEMQQWSRTFGSPGDDSGRCVRQTDDGGYIVTGWTARSASDPRDVCLMKVDAGGYLQWRRTLGGSDDDRGYSLAKTSDGGYVIAGQTGSVWGPHLFDVYVVKADPNGRQEWSRSFGGGGDDRGYCVQQTNDGGYIVVGFTQSLDGGDGDVYLIKTDNSGNEEWSKTFGGSRPDYGFYVEEIPDGGFMVTGDTWVSFERSSDVYLIKTDAEGNEIWSRTYGGSDADRGFCVRQTSEGGYVVAGRTRSWGAGSHDVYLVKTDADGNELWSRTFGGSGDDLALSVAQTADMGYIVAGVTLSYGSGWEDAYVIKTDATGNEEWSKTYGGTNRDFASSVRQTQDGGYIFTGETYSFGAGLFDVYLVKTDAQGNAPLPDPVVSTISAQESAVEITLRPISGNSYQLQSCNDLLAGDWISLGDPVSGTGDLISLSDPSAVAVRSRFYRVLCLP